MAILKKLKLAPEYFFNSQACSDCGLWERATSPCLPYIKNGNFTDNCPELNSLRTRLLKMCSYIMDKHVKGRFEEMTKISQLNYSCNCVRIEIPNATRVAGFYRMIQTTLRNKPVIDIASKIYQTI